MSVCCLFISVIKIVMIIIVINSVVIFIFEKVNVCEIDDDLCCDWLVWFEFMFIFVSNMW